MTFTPFCTCCARSVQDGHVRHAHTERCPAHPEAPVLRAAERCRNANPNRVYGHEVTYRTHQGDELKVHFVGGEANARRKAMLKTHAREVIAVDPMTETTYVKAFGRPGRM